MLEEKKMEAFEERKNREENRKYNKQVQEVRKQEKAKGRKDFNNDVTNSRKGKGGEDIEELLANNKGGAAEKSKKRLAMDKKYGHGGKDAIKRAKVSDRKSLNDLTDFNPRGNIQCPSIHYMPSLVLQPSKPI